MNEVNQTPSPPSRALLALFLVCEMIGCGVKPVPGGTKGTLRSEQAPLSDIQITLHQRDADEYRPIGFGVADADGRFQLYSNGAKGPLWLPPGEYRCTLESTGSPLNIPGEYAAVDATPLAFTWSQDDEQLDLEVPDF